MKSEASFQLPMLAKLDCCYVNTITSSLTNHLPHQNILIHPDSLDIKLTNFDLAMDLELSEKGVCGHSEEGYLPPEYFMIGEYEPFAATTWALGKHKFWCLFCHW